MENIIVSVCEHTGNPVVQEKFGKEWVCMHGDNEQEDIELIKKIEL